MLTVALGIAMIVAAPAYLKMGWLHVKLALVGLLIVYHVICFKFVRDFAQRPQTRTAPGGFARSMRCRRQSC